MVKFLKSKKLVVILLGIAIVLVAVYLLPTKSNQKANIQNTQAVQTTPISKTSVNVNKDFDFSVGINPVIPIKYSIESAELRDQIVIKGQRASAVEGRMFLIINLKLKNEQNKNININTREYVRISVKDNGEEWLAPEVHNDPVEVQAISTKYTRLAFAVDKGIKKFKMQVGEVNGEKQTIDLIF